MIHVNICEPNTTSLSSRPKSALEGVPKSIPLRGKPTELTVVARRSLRASVEWLKPGDCQFLAQLCHVALCGGRQTFYHPGREA